MGILELLKAVGKGLVKQDDAAKQIAEMGYPESVAKRIASGELPMDEASRMARAKQQDFNVDVPLYHWSDTHGILEFLPSQKGKLGSGVYTTPEYEYGRKYTATENPAVYELFQKGKLAEPTETSGIIESVRKELFDNPEDAGKYSVNDWKRISNERLNAMGYSGRSINDTRRNGKEYLPIEQTAFEGKSLRDKNRAAFDPEYEGSNILGFQGGKPDVGGGLMSAVSSGAGYMPSDDTDYGEDATSAYAGIPEQIWNNMSMLDKAALVTSPIPFVGAGTGILADLANMYNNPEERTGLNAALLAANVIPGAKIADAAGGILGSVRKMADDYRGAHTAPMRDSGAPAHELAGDIYPEDFYSPEGFNYYANFGGTADRESYNIARSLRGNPDADVTIYRAVPKGTKEINKGDWVAVSKKYAKEHGESALGGDYEIISKKVKAKDIYTNGDSINEWGYDPSKAK